MANPPSSSSTTTATTSTTSPMAQPKRIHLPSSPSRNPSSISQTYKLASELFLTRRLYESYTLLTSLTHPSSTSESPALSLPTARPTLHAKVWVLYLCLLNSIFDLGSTEGGQLFGSAQFGTIVEQVRDGGVWDDVVQRAYDGEIGHADASVIFNLITTSLAHAVSQRDTQSRIEMFLAASARTNSSSQTSLNDTPATLKQRVRIIELFALHVLPRNNEWAYARELISASEILDHEQRESYLQALEELLHFKEDHEKEERAQVVKPDAPLEKQIVEKQIVEKPPQPSSQPPAAKPQASNPKPTPPTTSSQASTRRPRPRPTPPSPALSLLTQFQTLLSSTMRILQSVTSPFRNNSIVLLRVLMSLVAIVMIFGRREVRERLRRVLVRGWGAVGGTVRMGVGGGYM